MEMYCSQKLDNKRINCMLANVHKKTIFFPNFHAYFFFLVLKRMTDNKKYKNLTLTLYIQRGISFSSEKPTSPPKT